MNGLAEYLKEQIAKYRQKETKPLLSAFKAHGDYWYSEWTNNLEDRDAEFFSGKSIRDYVSRVDMGLTPYPDLWVWHSGKETKIGTTRQVGYTEKEGVVIAWAVGSFDDTPRAQLAKDYYNSSKEIHGTSHGFVYPQERKQGRVYQSFNTFELTVLPPEVASNPYANFESKEFQMNEKKYEYLVKVFGAEEAAKIKAEQETKASTLSQIAEFKEFFSVEDATATKTEEKEHSHEHSDETETALKQIAGDLITDVGELTEGQLGIMRRVKEAFTTVEKLTKQVESLSSQVKALTKKVEVEIEGKPRRASEDDATMEDDEDEENKSLKERLEAKEEKAKDDIWGMFREKAATK